jgi:archaetidylinositol phosphate synthase
MIDSKYRSHYQILIVDPLMRWKIFHKISPILLTILGGVVGIAVCPLLAFHQTQWAITALFLSGFMDTLDGSLARHLQKTSSKGAVLDIVMDRSVEFATILGLFLIEPESRAIYCLFMLGAVLLCVTSFLVVGIFLQNQSEKSFHYSPGIIERFEAFLFFAAMIVGPDYFTTLAVVFTVLVILTTGIRVGQFLLNE